VKWSPEISLEAFRQVVDVETTRDDYPEAVAIAGNIPVYDGSRVDEKAEAEWARILLDGPGAFAIRGASTDMACLDAATEVFREIIAEERAAGGGRGDHFAKAGANDRVWNSHQKLCMKAPDVYARYVSNPVIARACRAWLGPGYQFTTQLNVVRPGGKAQEAHRDYHLGFMQVEEMLDYPAHVHRMSPTLVLQGGLAHCDMSAESGTTKLLPYSQRYLAGYAAVLRPEFRAYFEAHCVQLPLRKGDAVFFSPALFHAAGENRTADVIRTVNLLQICSVLTQAMETVDRTAMSLAVFPYLAALGPEERAAAIAATASGYPFPTNLDTDPPLGGLAPESQQQVLARAVAEGWTREALAETLAAQEAKRRA
jgi:ectoine hydroxylase-related dioxygenase (phytanoyl-CoA dioxygenase family)